MGVSPFLRASQVALMVKNLPFNTGDIRDASSTPGSGRFPGGGHDNPLQYSCLENLMDRGAWQATVHGVTKSQRQLSTQHRHMRARTHTHTHHHSFPSGFSLFQQGLISPGVPAPYPELRKRMKAENKQKYIYPLWLNAPQYINCKGSSTCTLEAPGLEKNAMKGLTPAQQPRRRQSPCLLRVRYWSSQGAKLLFQRQCPKELDST